MKLVRPFLIVLAAFAITPLAHAQDAAPLKQPGKWAQDYIDRQADPDVRFGTLPNGLRYAIQKNDTPKGAVSMRMLIGSGSLKEREEERGLAHFLEHMAFRGSTNVPDGEVVHMLERLGLRFGPDTNASTAHQRTLYMFNFPQATPEALDTGLTLFREIGERLTLDPKAVEAEKGVVLSEERLRDTPQLKAAQANVDLLLAGTLVPERWPIGTVETIKAATSERLRRYYLANYRPENATIVVVGAIDPDAVEAQIKARFSDWKAHGPADRYNPATPVHKERAAEYVADGVPDQLSLNWVGPVDERAETLAVDRERIARIMAILVLNNRLGDRALEPGSPFVAAGAGLSDSLLDTASVVTLNIQAEPAKWRSALDGALEQQRMLLRDGVSADELKRAANSLIANLQAAAGGASTRPDESIADALVSSALDGDLYTNPEQDLDLIKGLLAQETPETVTAALRGLFAGAQPLVFRAAHADPATPAVLQAALAQAQTAPLPAAKVEQAAAWPYADFGKPGAIVSRRDDTDLGATIVTFANGTRLVAKQTDLEKDRVSLSFGFGQGQAGVPEALAHAEWAISLFPAGGMGKMTVPALRNFMQTQGKLGGIQPSLGVPRLWLNGATRPADLGFEMQLLTAFATDPGFRPEMNAQLQASGPMLKTRIDTTPAQVFSRGLSDLLYGGDSRFAAVPSDADIDATQPADLPALLRPMLATPADVVIVGDIPVEEAIRLTAETIGAVPRQARPPEPDVVAAMTPAREAPYVFRHGGRADQAMYGLVWQLPDFHADPQASHVADVASAIVKARLVDTVREKMGLTYSPSAGAFASPNVKGLGYFAVQTETPPEKFDAMRAAVLDVIADVANKPISDDELDRARKPLVESAQKQRETNMFWVRNLGQVLRQPDMREEVLNGPQATGAVTAAQVQALLKRYVTGKTPLTVTAQAR